MDALLVFFNLLFFVALALTFFVSLLYLVMLLTCWLLHFLCFCSVFLKYRQIKEKLVNRIIVTAKKDRVEDYFDLAQLPFNFRLEFLNLDTFEKVGIGHLEPGIETVPGLVSFDESRPFLLEGPSTRKEVEIIFDYKIRIEDEVLAEKLASKFKEYRQQYIEGICQIRGSFSRGLINTEFIEAKEFGRLASMPLMVIVPLGMFYVGFKNLLLRERYLLKMRKLIRRGAQFDEW